MYFGFFNVMNFIWLWYKKDLYICIYLGIGVLFGDVVLMFEDCVWMVMIIVEEVMDLFVVDWVLYNWVVKEVLVKEYEDKVVFINNNFLFFVWIFCYKK